MRKRWRSVGRPRQRAQREGRALRSRSSAVAKRTRSIVARARRSCSRIWRPPGTRAATFRPSARASVSPCMTSPRPAADASGRRPQRPREVTVTGAHPGLAPVRAAGEPRRGVPAPSKPAHRHALASQRHDERRRPASRPLEQDDPGHRGRAAHLIEDGRAVGRQSGSGRRHASSERRRRRSGSEARRSSAASIAAGSRGSTARQPPSSRDLTH
jgi:hypothetical protein